MHFYNTHADVWALRQNARLVGKAGCCIEMMLIVVHCSLNVHSICLLTTKAHHAVHTARRYAAAKALVFPICKWAAQALLAAGAVILALIFVITSLGGDGPSSSERRPPGQQVDVPLYAFTCCVHAPLDWCCADSAAFDSGSRLVAHLPRACFMQERGMRAHCSC